MAKGKKSGGKKQKVGLRHSKTRQWTIKKGSSKPVKVK